MRRTKDAKNPYRLSESVSPTAYFVRWIPNQKIFALSADTREHLIKKMNEPEAKELFMFCGAVEINLSLARATETVTLHAHDLKITDGYIDKDGIRHGARSVKYNKKYQTATLSFGKKIGAGACWLYIEYSGTLNDDMCGAYGTTYQDGDVWRYGIATQFEATDARRVFPCFDEPAKKATVEFSLDIPHDLTALSNMPVEYETSTGAVKIVTFKTTPRMSTYLMAFTVMKFEYIEATDRYGVKVRVYTTPGKKEHGRFGLEVALHTLPALADYYGMKYPLPKLDLVAIPDFAAGAMENWGIETFRETALLVDPKNDSVAARERIADVVDHELAHHWFGNLVTMYWWNHIWLNEGFADFVENKMVDLQFPAWERTLRFISESVLAALHAMDKKNSHPIECEVQNPEEIRENFDTTTYSGGGSVNLMNEQYLTEEGFRKGLREYLQTYAYGNATTQNLWDMIERATGKPIRSVMGTFTRNTGYPLVTVEEQENKEATTRRFKLSQERFLFDGSKDKKNQTWTIPIGTTARNASKPTYSYMFGKNMMLEVPVRPGDWVKFNPGTTSLYRVLYPPYIRNELRAAVKAGDLGPADRIGLLDDVFALAKAGHVPMVEAVETLSAYEKESSYYVWSMIAGALGDIDHILHPGVRMPDDAYTHFREYAKNFFADPARVMTWNKRGDETNASILLRALALRCFGGYGDTETITTARAKIDAFLAGEPLDPDIRQAVYILNAENGGPEALKKLMRVYDSTEDHQEKIRVLRAIGKTQDPDTVRRVLDLAVSNKVRKQDTVIVFVNTDKNQAALPIVWNYIKKNWKLLYARYHGDGIRHLGNIVGVAKRFKTEDMYRDVKRFFADHPLKGAKRTMAETLEEIRLNIAIRKRDKDSIARWFAERASARGPVSLTLTTEALMTELPELR